MELVFQRVDLPQQVCLPVLGVEVQTLQFPQELDSEVALIPLLVRVDALDLRFEQLVFVAELGQLPAESLLLLRMVSFYILLFLYSALLRLLGGLLVFL